jgi:hypothetical protein
LKPSKGLHKPRQSELVDGEAGVGDDGDVSVSEEDVAMEDREGEGMYLKSHLQLLACWGWP